MYDPDSTRALADDIHCVALAAVLGYTPAELVEES